MYRKYKNRLNLTCETCPFPLTDKDIIVLADFDNETGDPALDDTPKTALTVALKQSPFLNALSEDKVASILKEMTRPAGTKLMPEIARELCQRAASKVYIAGRSPAWEANRSGDAAATDPVCSLSPRHEIVLQTIRLAPTEVVLTALSNATPSRALTLIRQSRPKKRSCHRGKRALSASELVSSHLLLQALVRNAVFA